MTAQKKSDKQLPLFEAQGQWFHVFKSMVEGGDAKKLGGTVVLVYLVLKCYVDFNSGRSFPGIELIADKSGLSERQVIRCLKVLSEYGYIEIEQAKGKRNIYKLREKIPVTNSETGDIDSIVSFDYIPSAIKAVQHELKNFLVTGNKDGNQYIKIETLNLTVNVQNIERGDGIVYNLDNVKDPSLRQKIQQIEEARKRARANADKERESSDVDVTPQSKG
jgi:hypothetical protein